MPTSITKLLFMLVLAGVAAPQAHAQVVGVKLGPTFSKLSVEDDGADGEPETLTAFGGGAFIRFGFQGLSLQAELLTLTKGAAQTVSDPEFGNATFELKLNYAEIPITAMFPVGPLYVFAGPSVGFELSCKVDLETDEFSIEDGDCEEDGTDEAARKSIDFSVVAGAGIEIPMGTVRLLLEGRYIHGLTNLDDSTFDNTETRNRTWALFAGVAAPLKR